MTNVKNEIELKIDGVQRDINSKISGVQSEIKDVKKDV
jgi:hypothetical protein